MPASSVSQWQREDSKEMSCLGEGFAAFAMSDLCAGQRQKCVHLNAAEWKLF